MTTTRKRPRPRTNAPKRDLSTLTTLLTVLGVGALLFGIAWLAVSYDDDPAARDVSAPSIQGDVLPQADGPDGGGWPAPVATGESLAGEGNVTIPEADEPTMIVFLAHWCPACQQEVPVVQQWVNSGGLPEGVALRGVITGSDPLRPNYPPEAWLEREGWSVPTLYGDGSVADAYGLDATPFWVFVDGSGTVVGRTAGMLSPEQLTAVAEGLAQGGS